MDFDQAKYWRPIQAILMQDWDPIGVADEPNAADEYDRYIRASAHCWQGTPPSKTLWRTWDEIAVQRMGFTPHPELCLTAADKLVKLGVWHK